MTAPVVSRSDVVRFRLRRHQLVPRTGTDASPPGVALLDYGVQDTGPDGATWALRLRAETPPDPNELAYAWTLRGAPHAYRRADLAAVAVAVAPRSETDAAKRIFDAAKPLRAAGIPVLDALRTVAERLRAIVERPVAKGDASGRLTEELDPPYLRYCRPCATTHIYEQPFRLAALQAGLELEAGTSPPVLRRVRGLRPACYEHLAGEAEARVDVIRNHLRFYGPARARDVAGFLDAPVKEIKAGWPADSVEVVVSEAPAAGPRDPRFVLAEDLEALVTDDDPAPRSVRLLGPYDPYLQLRDRELLVGDEVRRKDLWRVLGRPGAIVADGEVVGGWRPRASGGTLTVRIEPWGPLPARDLALVEEQAERLAEHRGVTLAGVVEAKDGPTTCAEGSPA